MKQNKCENCGAEIEIDENQKEFVCQYCGSRFVNEKKSVVEELKNTINSITATEQTSSSSVGRPKLNVGLFVLGIIFYFWPGIIYLMITIARQKEWDKTHGAKK